MNTINYDKYSTMSINQLISALNNAEKKQAKIKEKLKQELLKFLDEPQPKPSRNEPQEPKRLSAILADNQTDLNAIDDENTNPLFDELAEQKKQITP